MAEGLAREVVNKLNTMRRELDLAVTDRIEVVIQTGPAARSAIEAHLPYIKEETLATLCTFGQTTGSEWDLNGEPSVITIRRTQG